MSNKSVKIAQTAALLAVWAAVIFLIFEVIPKAFPNERGSSNISFGNINAFNTVYPVIQKMVDEACEVRYVPEGSSLLLPDSDGYVDGAQLIYKVIPDDETGSVSCIGDTRNQYYARCYKWDYRMKDPKKPYSFDKAVLHKKVVKDVDLGVFSCIPESDMEIPYDDEVLRKAKVGDILIR